MIHRLKSFFRSLTGRKHLETSMDEELRFHIEAYEQDLIRSGMSADEAHRKAQREFGSIERMKEECREAKGLLTLDEFHRNIRYAFRTLRRSPGTTATVVLTLALCIGVNTAVYSIVDAVLFRPLPYPEPEKMGEVVREIVRDEQVLEQETLQNGRTWEALKQGQSYNIAAIGMGGAVNLGKDGQATIVHQERISHGYFHVIGIPLLMGREFEENEDHPNGPALVILSHRLWSKFFHSDSSILGQSISLKGEPYTVIGIASKEFQPTTADLWLPLQLHRSGEGGGFNSTLITRVKHSSTWEEANAEIQRKGFEINQEQKLLPGHLLRISSIPFKQSERSSWRSSLMILWGAAGCIFLIGCLNIASLMLARSKNRQQEMGTRIALGGGVGSLFKQLLTESLLLGFLGGSAGLIVGYTTILMLNQILPDFGIWQKLHLDTHVLLLTGGLSIGVSLLFGIAPTLQAIKVDVREILVEGSSRTFTSSRSWSRKVLVLIEVSFVFALLIGAGLLVRTLIYLQSKDPGFREENVVTGSISLQDARYRSSVRINQLFSHSLEQIQNLAGVESAAVGLHMPYQQWLNSGIIIVNKSHPEGKAFGTSVNYVTPKYFDTLQIPLRSGRYFTDHDNEKSEPVMIVNETFVRQILHHENALESYSRNHKGQLTRIIGVVGDIQQTPGLVRLNPVDPEPAVFFPAMQFTDQDFNTAHTWFSPYWVVRSQNSLSTTSQQLKEIMQKIDPLLPFRSFQSINIHRETALKMQSLHAWLLGSFASLALLLASVGIYGLIANLTIERTREFGIRLSMGASVLDILWKAVAPGLGLSLLGTALGTIFAAGSVRILSQFVYGIPLLDLWTFVSAGIVLIAISGIASFIPSIKLLRLDPAMVLRQG